MTGNPQAKLQVLNAMPTGSARRTVDSEGPGAGGRRFKLRDM